MGDDRTASSTSTRARVAGPLCPFDLRVEPIARFLNCEIVDHPIYDGLELQVFDDAVHGRGMLAFLSRRADRRVDYYVEPGLRVRRDLYAIAGGTGRWTVTDFERARLDVAPDGVHADVRFTDVDGRPVEVRVDDRDGRRRRRAPLLAPFGADVDDPQSLLLVLLREFDLVRRGRQEPVVVVDGRQVTTGALPLGWLHRRHLVKYGSRLVAVTLNPARSGPLGPADGRVERDADSGGVTALTAGAGDATAAVAFDPAFPDLAALEPGAPRRGAWRVDVAGALQVTGGTWTACRDGDRVDLALDVTRRWTPRGLPPLMRVVTRVIPTFRRWPTTYRWTGTITLGDPATLESGWERTADGGADAYRRATARST